MNNHIENYLKSKLKDINRDFDSIQNGSLNAEKSIVGKDMLKYKFDIWYGGLATSLSVDGNGVFLSASLLEKPVKTSIDVVSNSAYPAQVLSELNELFIALKTRFNY